MAITSFESMGAALRASIKAVEPRAVDKGRAGVYTLANDRVLDWTLAFINSVRLYDERVAIWVIPFDKNISILAQHREKLGFSFYQDPSFSALDALGLELCAGKTMPAHAFRKFACFWGPLDSFLYIDSDVVVLESVGDLLETLYPCAADFVYADTDMEQVYVPGEFRRKMMKTCGAVGFNTGFWFGRKGLFDMNTVTALSTQAQEVLSGFATHTMEQPFFNYCIDELDISKAVLHEVIPGTAHHHWANRDDIDKVEGDYRVIDTGAEDHEHKLFFVHWAGIALSADMPHYDLYKRSRLLTESMLGRITWRVQRRMALWHKRAYRFLARNRILRKVYRAIVSPITSRIHL